MVVKRKSSSKVTKPKKGAARKAPATTTRGAPLKALPQPEPGPNPECGEPGGGRGRVDIVGRRPKGIRVDPYFLEGHPGYAESGSSELSMPKRAPAKKKPAPPRKAKRR